MNTKVTTPQCREPMRAASIRIPSDDMKAARRWARACKCQLADVFRAAIHDHLAQNGQLA